MFAWILAFISGLKMVNADLPTIEAITEKVVGGIGQFIAMVAGQIWGPAAATNIQGYVSRIEGIIQSVDADAQQVITWIDNEVPDITTLFNLLPGVDKELYARVVAMNQEYGITPTSTAAERAEAHKMVAKCVAVAHANVRVAEAKAAAAKATPAKP